MTSTSNGVGRSGLDLRALMDRASAENATELAEHGRYLPGYGDQVEIAYEQFEIGVAALTRENYVEARRWLAKAVDNGVDEARPMLQICLDVLESIPERRKATADEKEAELAETLEVSQDESPSERTPIFEEVLQGAGKSDETAESDAGHFATLLPERLQVNLRWAHALAVAEDEGLVDAFMRVILVVHEAEKSRSRKWFEPVSNDFPIFIDNTILVAQCKRSTLDQVEVPSPRPMTFRWHDLNLRLTRMRSIWRKTSEAAALDVFCRDPALALEVSEQSDGAVEVDSGQP